MTQCPLRRAACPFLASLLMSRCALLTTVRIPMQCGARPQLQQEVIAKNQVLVYPEIMEFFRRCGAL